MMKRINTQDGFTIMELLVAMSVFSSMLIIASLTVIQIGKMYYKGVNNIKTQEVARTAVASIVEQIQFRNGKMSENSKVFNPGSDSEATIHSRCIGTVRYSYILQARLVPGEVRNRNVDQQQSPHVLWQDTTPDLACNPADLTQISLSNGRELMGENMRLITFDIDPVLDANGDVSRAEMAQIRLDVVFGDNELLERSSPGDQSTDAIGCAGGVVGAQWCSRATLSTVATRRIL